MSPRGSFTINRPVQSSSSRRKRNLEEEAEAFLTNIFQNLPVIEDTYSPKRKPLPSQKKAYRQGRMADHSSASSHQNTSADSNLSATEVNRSEIPIPWHLMGNAQVSYRYQNKGRVKYPVNQGRREGSDPVSSASRRYRPYSMNRAQRSRIQDSFLSYVLSESNGNLTKQVLTNLEENFSRSGKDDLHPSKVLILIKPIYRQLHFWITQKAQSISLEEFAERNVRKNIENARNQKREKNFI
jgi:hypothetical protein